MTNPLDVNSCYTTIADLLNRLEIYGFECEGGPLENTVEWRRLRFLLGENH